jgi:hypothetical protein
MGSRVRTDLLTTVQMYNLDNACTIIDRAFGECPYLVGTAGVGGAESYRDVDVRLMLDDDEFAQACPTLERWELLCVAISAYLSERSGLPVDFQVQRVTEANGCFGGKPRNPLGMGGRSFAGGGDATPDWGARQRDFRRAAPRRGAVSLYQHVPHPHLKHRAETGPVKVGAVKPGANIVTRINTRAAVIVTRGVGTMWCAYAFCLLAFYGLPAGLHNGAAGFVQWASSQFIQLVLLPIIIVGAAVLAEATDRMNKRQFDDVEATLHGQSELAAHLAAQDDKILAILEQLKQNTALTEAVKAALTEPATQTLTTPVVIDGKEVAREVARVVQKHLLERRNRNGGDDDGMAGVRP